MTLFEGEDTMARQKRNIRRRKSRTSSVESLPNTPCPRWVQRRMRANLRRAMRCPVNTYRALRAAEILAQASQESKSLVQEQAAAPASTPTEKETIHPVSTVADSPRDQVAPSRRWHRKFKDITKVGANALKQCLRFAAFPRSIKRMGRRTPA